MKILKVFSWLQNPWVMAFVFFFHVAAIFWRLGHPQPKQPGEGIVVAIERSPDFRHLYDVSVDTTGDGRADVIVFNFTQQETGDLFGRRVQIVKDKLDVQLKKLDSL